MIEVVFYILKRIEFDFHLPPKEVLFPLPKDLIYLPIEFVFDFLKVEIVFHLWALEFFSKIHWGVNMHPPPRFSFAKKYPLLERVEENKENNNLGIKNIVRVK